MLSSWMYRAASMVPPVRPFSWGQRWASWSESSRLRLKKWGLSWMSMTPGSQYSIRMFIERMAISPRPPWAEGSQKIPLTPVPCLSLRHQLSE